MRLKVLFSLYSSLILSIFNLYGENSKVDTLLHQGVETALIESIRISATNNYIYQLKFLDSCNFLYPDNPVIQYELSKLYYTLGDDEKALDFSIQADSLDNNNIWYKDLLFTIYLKNQNYQEAAKVCKELISIKPNDEEKYLMLSEIYKLSGNVYGAIEVIDSYKTKFGDSYDFVNEMEYSLLNEYVISMKSLNDSSEYIIDKCYQKYISNQNDVNYARLLSFAYVNGEKYDRVRDLLKNMYPDSEHQSLYLDVSELLLRKGHYDLFKKYSNKGLSSKNIDYQNKYKFVLDLSNQYVQDRDTVDKEYVKVVKAAILNLKQKYKDSVDIAMVYCDWLKNNNDPVYMDELEKILPLYKEKKYIYNELINEYFTRNDKEKVFYYTDLAIKEYPEESMPYYYRAAELLMADDYHSALEYLNKGLEYVPQFSIQHAMYCGLIGDCYYNLNDREKSFKYFDQSLRIYPDNYLLLNNYAYYLSELELNLDKAKSMSWTALSSDLLNPVYLDTYAWILYKLDDYGNALKYMKKAIENCSKDESKGLYFEHYGDILKANNDVEGALKYWRTALQNPGIDKEKILEKIKNSDR